MLLLYFPNLEDNIYSKEM